MSKLRYHPEYAKMFSSVFASMTGAILKNQHSIDTNKILHDTKIVVDGLWNYLYDGPPTFLDLE